MEVDKRPPISSPPKIKHGALMLPFVLMTVIFAGILGWVMATETYNKFLLAFSGVPIEATINSRYIDSDDDGDSYYLRLNYRVLMQNGRFEVFNKTVSVNSGVYNSYPTDSTISIRYDPNDPTRIGLERNFTVWGWLRSAGLFSLVLLGFLLLLLLSLGLGAYAWSQLRDSVRLKSEGKMAMGYVEGSWVEVDDGNRTYYLAVSGATPDGQRRFGAPVKPSEYNQYQAGGPIEFVYHPRDEKLNKLVLKT